MFTTGQKVVCINDKFPAWVYKLYVELPVIGKVYTIRDVVLGQAMDVSTSKFDTDISIYLKELDNPIHSGLKREPGFREDRFKPLTENVIEEEERDLIPCPA